MTTRRWILALAALLTPLVGVVGASSVPTAAAAAVATVASKGCSSAATPVQGQQSFAYSAAGDTGSYIVEMPPSAVAGHPLPLIIDLHGYEETAAIQVDISRLGTYGATEGFITVTPQVNDTVPHWDQALGRTRTSSSWAVFSRMSPTPCASTAIVCSWPATPTAPS